MAVSQSSTHGGSSVTYLDHDHCEGESVRFLAIPPLIQDLRCGPPRGVAMLTRGALHGVQISSYGGEAKISDACTTGVVHKDVSLAGYQYSCETRSRTVTHSLEVPVNHTARVEVAKAVGYIG